MTCSVTIGAMPLGTSRTKTQQDRAQHDVGGDDLLGADLGRQPRNGETPDHRTKQGAAPPTMNQMMICADCTTLKTGGLT